MRYLSPAGVSAVPDESYGSRRFMPKARTGLLANSFPGSVDFLSAFSEELTRRHGVTDFIRYEKGGIRDSTEVLPAARIAAIAKECDQVFAAYGHCGSCSSALIRDAVALARLGLAVTVFVTDEFREVVTFISRAAGMSDIPVVYLPHPMASLDPLERATIAVAKTNEAIQRIEGAHAFA